MPDSTEVPEKRDPRDGVLVTISLGLDNLTIGTLRWLVALADASGLDDSAALYATYNEQWTEIVEGIELYIRADALRNVPGPK